MQISYYSLFTGLFSDTHSQLQQMEKEDKVHKRNMLYE